MRNRLSCRGLPARGLPVLVALAGLAFASPAEARQTHAGHGTGADHAAHANPYAAFGDREIKALANDEVAALLAGEGMGFALAAELNGIPGPLHILELVEALELAPAQVEAVEAIFRRMRTETAALGAQVVEFERTLDRRFAHRHIDAAMIRDLTGQIAELRGRIRATHLEAHLEVDALLSDEVRARYLELRGYGAGDHGVGPHEHP
jgi:hypothetical protein